MTYDGNPGVKRYNAVDRLAAVEACLMMAGSDAACGTNDRSYGPHLAEVFDEKTTKGARLIDLCKAALWAVVDTIDGMRETVERLWCGPQTAEVLAERQVLDRELWAGAGELLRDGWAPGEKPLDIREEVKAEIAEEQRRREIVATMCRCDSEPHNEEPDATSANAPTDGASTNPSEPPEEDAGARPEPPAASPGEVFRSEMTERPGRIGIDSDGEYMTDGVRW